MAVRSKIAMARARGMALVAVALVAGCAAHVPPKPATATPTQTIFRFHVGMWANLHQVLVHEALSPRPGFDGPKSNRGKKMADLAALDPEERESFRRALLAYDARFTTRNTFTDEHVAAVLALTAAGDAPSLPRAGLPDDVFRALNQAAPAYRAHFWTDHASVDRAYVTAIEPLVVRHGAWLVARLAALYQTPWPTAPVDVEVAPAVPPFGASTVGEPPYDGAHRPLVIVSSADHGYSSESGLEMLFHEGSHLLVGKVEAMIAASANRQEIAVPPRLWHDVLFFTAGRVTRERLGPAYVPYAEQPQHAVLAPERIAALERTWQPYLDGETPLEAAVDAVVAASRVAPR